MQIPLGYADHLLLVQRPASPVPAVSTATAGVSLTFKGVPILGDLDDFGVSFAATVAGRTAFGDFGDFGVSFASTVTRLHMKRGGLRLSVRGEPLRVTF